MILTEVEANNRLNSEDNLINRLRSNLRAATRIPSMPPPVEDLVEGLEEKLADATLKNRAAKIMSAAMEELEHRIPEVKKPETLARIANEMNKVINDQAEKSTDEKTPRFVVFSPTIVQENHYETIVAKEI